MLIYLEMNLLMLSKLNGLIDGLKSSIGVWYILLINFIGVVAIVVKVCELQLKRRENIIKFFVLNGVLWVLYFLLNADLVSAITCLLGVAMGLIFLKRGANKWASSIAWLYIFLAVQVVNLLLFYNSWHDIFSGLAGVFAVLAYYSIREKNYRLLVLINLIFWVLNSAFKLYYVALIHDALGAISAIIAIVRYDILKKTSTKDKGENTSNLKSVENE